MAVVIMDDNEMEIEYETEGNPIIFQEKQGLYLWKNFKSNSCAMG